MGRPPRAPGYSLDEDARRQEAVAAQALQVGRDDQQVDDEPQHRGDRCHERDQRHQPADRLERGHDRILGRPAVIAAHFHTIPLISGLTIGAQFSSLKDCSIWRVAASAAGQI